MTRPPARPPLFPYPTLFRSQRGRHGLGDEPRAVKVAAAVEVREARRGDREAEVVRVGAGDEVGARLGDIVGRGGNLYRSEEHTSELQSHVNLVCRLLLEKKK